MWSSQMITYNYMLKYIFWRCQQQKNRKKKTPDPGQKIKGSYYQKRNVHSRDKIIFTKNCVIYKIRTAQIVWGKVNYRNS